MNGDPVTSPVEADRESRVDSVGLAAGIAVAVATVTYIILIVAQGDVVPADVGAVAGWAAAFAATALAVVALSTTRVAPPVRTFGLGALSLLLVVAGFITVFTIGAPLLLGAVLAAMAAVRSAPGSGSRYAAVAIATLAIAVAILRLSGFVLSFVV